MSAEDLLQIFFGHGNEIRLDRVLDGEYGKYGEDLKPWIRRLRNGEWTILPRRIEDQVAWYAITNNEEERDRVALLLRAWIGPGFTDFDGRTPQRCSDDWEVRLESKVGPAWIRCRVRPTRVDDVRNALSMLVRLQAGRPSRVAEDVIPTGRLIRNLDWTLRAKDGETSRAIIESLERSGRISAMNIKYLKVQRLFALAEWDALMSMPGLFDVIASRRPKAVTKALLRGLYEMYLAMPFSHGDMEAAVSIFAGSIAGRFNSLFEALPESLELHEFRLYSLWAALPPGKPSLAVEVASAALRDGIVDPLSNRILSTVSAPSEIGDPLDAVKRAIDDYAFSSAMDQLRLLSDGAQHAALTIRCAVEIGTSDAMEFALETLQGLRERDLAALKRSRVMNDLIKRVASYSSRPNSWASLFAAVRDGLVQAKDLDWVRDEVPAWGPSRLLEDHERLVASITAELDLPESQVMRSVLPWLVTAIDKHSGTGDPRLRAITSAVAHALALSESRSAQERDVFLDLCEGLLDGANSNEYVELVELIGYIMEVDDSPSLVPWVLEALEIVAGYPVADFAARDSLAAKLVDFLIRRSDRLTGEGRLIAALVLDEFGFEVGQLLVAPEDGAPPSVTWPRGFSIGIYTLTPGVGQRVVSSVNASHPDVDIYVNSDHVATDSLRSLAQEMDLFILVSRSAKHAATDAIKAARDKDAPTLYPSGKGSSSILTALNEYMAQL